MKEPNNEKFANLVSIVIPVYNKVSYIRETLDSALSQTYSHTEIVLVNDGSTDGSLEILIEFASQYPNKIKLINSINKGVSVATNLGIQAASGDYIQFLDADDLISPDKIEKQVNLLMEKGNHAIASCEWVTFLGTHENHQQWSLNTFKDYPNSVEMLLDFFKHSEMMAISSYLTPKELIAKVGLLNEKLTINQDGEFFCRVLLHSEGIYFEPKGKVFYRKPGESNVSQQKSQKASASLLESYRCYEREILKMEDSKRVREAIARNYLRFCYVTYPNFPDLLKEAKRDFKRMGVDKSVRIGGPKFQLITKFLGFDQAMKLKRFFQ